MGVFHRSTIGQVDEAFEAHRVSLSVMCLESDWVSPSLRDKSALFSLEFVQDLWSLRVYGAFVQLVRQFASRVSD